MSDGIILLDKPGGISSAAAIAPVKRRYGRGVKVGHAGTLDPFATGLLLVLVGRATRTQRFLLALPKTYVVVARFGAVSTTGDPEGEITETGVVPSGALSLPTGVLRQRPPAFSALKVGGERAYRLARRGEPVQLPERDVHVFRFEERSRSEDGARREFEIECSSGTYVRSLITSLGDAYCLSLRRTAIGPFDVADAAPERVVELSQALSFLPAVSVEGEEASRALHGSRIVGEASGPVRVNSPEGLIGIFEPAEPGVLKALVVLRGQ